MASEVRIQFNHGIGDCVYFAHLLPLYTRRGYEFEIQCSGGKTFMFSDCESVSYVEGASFTKHPWIEQGRLIDFPIDKYYLANKCGRNISVPPLPNIGVSDDSLWAEYCSVELDLTTHLTDTDRHFVQSKLSNLPKPLILLHTSGNALRGYKDVKLDTAKLACDLITREVGGTVIDLNWDGRVPAIPTDEVVSMKSLFDRPLGIANTIALFELSDLLIGIDSGPAHLARFTKLPVIIVWKDHHPALFTLPRKQNYHLLPKRPNSHFNRHFRSLYHQIEGSESEVTFEEIAQTTIHFFDSKFFSGSPQGELPFRALLDRLKCNRPGHSRREGMAYLCEWLLNRSEPFRLIETGTMHPAEKWNEGCSTLLFGWLAHHGNGVVYSVDNDPARVGAAQENLAYLGDNLQCVLADSEQFIDTFDRRVDAVYLDSKNRKSSDCATHCLREVKKAHRLLPPGGLVAIHECRHEDEEWHGRGALAAPWLLDRGYGVSFEGEVSIFSKNST